MLLPLSMSRRSGLAPLCVSEDHLDTLPLRSVSQGSSHLAVPLVRHPRSVRMSWFPVGPNFVFAPMDSGFKRLSRRNEAGEQGLVSAIAGDPTDANQIHVTVRPSTGG